MTDKTSYFDITKLFKVMDANSWTEGKNFMKYWAEGKAKTANINPAKKKSTIGANLNRGLRIYKIGWQWLNKFSAATRAHREFFRRRVKNPAVRKLIVSKYANISNPNVIVSDFNNWLTDGMEPKKFLPYIKSHQLQYIRVAPFESNGKKFDDIVASLNGFNFFAFYKGQVIDGEAYRANQQICKIKKKPRSATMPLKSCNKDPLATLPPRQRNLVSMHLLNSSVKKVVNVTHVGIYAGDIYEFNGKQYLATWNLDDNTVELSKWDYLWGTSDTDDQKDLAITNETFNIYRKNTGNGGDFLVFSPIKLKSYSMIFPVH